MQSGFQTTKKANLDSRFAFFVLMLLSQRLLCFLDKELKLLVLLVQQALAGSYETSSLVGTSS